MRRRSIVALAVLVLVTAPMIALAWTCVVPEYQAGAEVRVRPFIPHLVFQTEDNGLIPFYDSYVNTQVSIMRSLTVLQRVLDEPQVLKTQWYKNPSKSLKQRLWEDPVPPLERLRLDDTQARLSALQQSIALLEWEKQHAVADDNNDVRVGAIEVPATPVDPNGSPHTEEAISLDHQLARAQKEEQLLHAELEKQRAEFNELFETAQLLERENNALKHKRDLFEAVRQRLDQKTMERNVRDVTATTKVLTRAFVSSEPHRDRRMLFTAIALVVGLGLSSGVAFLPGRRRKQ